MTAPGLVQSAGQSRQLVVAADHRQADRSLERRCSEHAAHVERLYRIPLALDHEWLERRHPEHDGAGVQDVGGRQHLARLRLPHHTRGEVHGVALDREGSPERRAEHPGEHPSFVHTDPERKPPRAVLDLPGRREHRRGLVAQGRGRAGHEEHLEPVEADVRLEEGHTHVGTRVLDLPYRVVQRRRERVGAVVRQDLIRASNFDERHRHRPVIRLLVPGDEMLPDPQRYA